MNVYLGMFLTASCTLALQVTLARLLSVVIWYHLAFLAISTAMLGMTAGAVRVYLDPKRYQRERLAAEVGRTCVAYSLALPAAIVLLCLLRLELDPAVMSCAAFLVATAACAFPFFFAGIVASAMITESGLPIGRLCASDLVGAALGCLFVLAGLERFDAPSLILLCSAVAALAGAVFALRVASPATTVRRVSLSALFVALAFANSYSVYGIRTVFVKGRTENVGDILLERWNSFSRVVVFNGAVSPPVYWGPSPVAPTGGIPQFMIEIDGEAGTSIRRFRSFKDIDHLRFDVTTVAYNLRRRGAACVIGVGGGGDIQSALLFGHNRVVGVEVNPVFVDLLEGSMSDFAGLGGRDDVELVVDDARSWLSRTTDRFSLIQMSLTDTWASTGAGAFSLTENALYTVEA